MSLTSVRTYKFPWVYFHFNKIYHAGGIMTSYQMKMAPQVTAKEQQETKYPLNELDALWKLK